MAGFPTVLSTVRVLAPLAALPLTGGSAVLPAARVRVFAEARFQAVSVSGFRRAVLDSRSGATPTAPRPRAAVVSGVGRTRAAWRAPPTLPAGE